MDEVLNYFKENFTRQEIIDRAKKDNEHPLGYIIGVIKDVFGIPKVDAYPICEKVLDIFGLTNKEC